MNQSGYSDTVNQMLDRLNRPLFLVALALLLFLAHFTLVSYSLDLFSPYNFNGMWITIPDFDKGINDPDSAFARIYYRLNGWDGQWYYHIAANGYQCDSIPESNNPHICNIAFFPLVPMLGSMLGLTGINLVYALPLVSQLFYFASILLLLFFIRSIGELRPVHLVPVLLFMAYPGSLYYFTPYSESSLSFLIIALFTLSYWQLRQPTNGKWCLLAIAGFMICLTKANGLMALGIPALMAFSYGWHERKFFTRAQLQLYAAAAAGSLGLVSFLIYSELRFDQWNIYFLYAKQGWSAGIETGIQLNPVAILAKFRWPEHLSGQVVNFLFLFMLPVIAGLAFVTWKDQGKQRIVSLTAICMIILYYYFHSSLVHSAGEGITALVRHLLPVVGMAAVLLVAARPRKPDWLPTGLLTSSMLAFSAIGFHFQKQLLDLFRYGYWVS
jgi:hypothetical protein